MKEMAFDEAIEPALVLLETYQRQPSDELYGEIVGICQSVDSVYPERAETHSILGVVHCTRNPELAEEHYRKAVELDPDNTVYLENFALLMHRIGKHDEAEAAYSRILDMGSDKQAFFHSQLGDLYYRTKRISDALHQYDDAIASGFDNAPIRNARGTVNVMLGNHRDAIRDFECVTRSRVCSPEAKAVAWANISGAYRKLGMRKESWEAYLSAVESHPDIGVDILLRDDMNNKSNLN